tara:strand:+ start:89 stop:313 length:225 start_codon:yes stop_codon:yes gene_type:complete
MFGSCEIIETEIKQKGTSRYGDRTAQKNNYKLGKVLEKERKIFPPPKKGVRSDKQIKVTRINKLCNNYQAKPKN